MDATEVRDARVLVIDDDDDPRTLVVRVVKQAGYAVDSVADGQAGLDRLAEQTYDVIVCDLRMPKMSGVTLYREVERRNPVAAYRAARACPFSDCSYRLDRARPPTVRL